MGQQTMSFDLIKLPMKKEDKGNILYVCDQSLLSLSNMNTFWVIEFRKASEDHAPDDLLSSPFSFLIIEARPCKCSISITLFYSRSICTPFLIMK